MSHPRTRLALQQLEDRTTPVLWNNPWPDAGHLKLSFAPDGTTVGSSTSTLSAELAPLGQADSQLDILRAFQTWAAAANINVSVVPDLGTPFGEPGPVQGGPFHGDIRIGATDLSAGELAISNPFDLFSGWTGSVLLNTSQSFDLGGSEAYDLYTVLLQEAGHVFGIGNSHKPQSVMYELYQGPRDGLHPSDIADIQTLYGARTPDRFEGTAGNDAMATATRLRFVSRLSQLAGTDGTAGRIPFVAAGDVTTLVDQDVYSVRVPLGARSFEVRLRTTGVSLLTAKLTVVDARGQIVGSAIATDPANGDLLVAVQDARPGNLYFIRVEGAEDDVFGIGAYRLTVGLAAASAVDPPNPQGLIHNDGSLPHPALFLGSQRPGSDLRWDFTYRASISGPRDKDTYTVRSQPEDPGTMVIVVWDLDGTRLNPVVTVYDQNRRPVPVELLADDPGMYTLQVRHVRPSTTYLIKIAADSRPTGMSRGNYFLGVDFRESPVTLRPLARGKLTAAEPDVAAIFTVRQDQLFHFALRVDSANPAIDSAARLMVLDESGNEVYTLFAAAGTSALGDVLLAAGTYTVIVAGGTPDGPESMPRLTYRLDGLVRTDPIGIGTEDPSSEPAQPRPQQAPAPTTTNTSPYDGPYTNPYRPT